MSYFIFQNNSDNIEGVLYKIAENQSDLNNLNIPQSVYKIIESSQENFNDVKLGKKEIVKYQGENIIFSNVLIYSINQEKLFLVVNQNKLMINQFLNNNKNHPLFNSWQNYYNQLNNLNLSTITYPLNKSLEQYFDDLGQPSLNTLQLP